MRFIELIVDYVKKTLALHKKVFYSKKRERYQ